MEASFVLIPLEEDNLFCLARVVALYRENGVTQILSADGSRRATSFTPLTLKKRGEALWDKYAVSQPPTLTLNNTVNLTEECL